jgi:hypothetical protein
MGSATEMVDVRPGSPNEVVIRSGRKIAVGSDWWELRGEEAPIHFVDLISEARPVDGVVYLGLASAAIDANNEAIATVACRLRMSLATAQSLRNLLDGIINDALSPADKSQAN